MGGRKRKLLRREGSETGPAFAFINREKIASSTETLIKYGVFAAYTLGCTQFGPEKWRSAGRVKYVRGSLKRRFFHYLITTLFWANLLHKIVVTVAKIREDGKLNMENMICASAFMVLFPGWAMSLGLVFRWRESIQLLNTWNPLVSAIDGGVKKLRTTIFLQRSTSSTLP